MMKFRKLQRTYRHGSLNYIPEFKSEFPELRNIDSEELATRFKRLKLDFYTEEHKPVSKYIRLTLPFALLVMVIMFIGLPINFMITGQWEYSSNLKIINWFRMLKLN